VCLCLRFFFFGWGIVPTPHENFSNFFDPPPGMFAQIIRKKGFLLPRLSQKKSSSAGQNLY
jgi:hypothetical protein